MVQLRREECAAAAVGAAGVALTCMTQLERMTLVAALKAKAQAEENPSVSTRPTARMLLDGVLKEAGIDARSIDYHLVLLTFISRGWQR
jgi:hypothetical protein